MRHGRRRTCYPGLHGAPPAIRCGYAATPRSRERENMIIGIPVYDKVDLLDVTGPHEILGWMDQPKADIRIIADKPREVVTRDGFKFKADYGYAEIEALDVLWVPGGDPGAL